MKTATNTNAKGFLVILQTPGILPSNMHSLRIATIIVLFHPLTKQILHGNTTIRCSDLKLFPIFRVTGYLCLFNHMIKLLVLKVINTFDHLKEEPVRHNCANPLGLESEPEINCTSPIGQIIL